MSSPETRTGITAPPSGTGNVPGLGEAFTVNLNTGQGVYAYKFPLPEGRAGHGAKLGLEYSHGSGLGPFGIGWRLALRSISRRLDFGLPGSGAAERWLDDGQELVETPDGSYAATSESAFTRYTRSGDGWLIEERNGIVHECGLTEAGREAEPEHPERVQNWLVERSLDTSGNTIEYTYERHGGATYLASVRWGIYELRFAYEDRPDVRQDGRRGFLRTLAWRCAGVELFLDPGTETERRIRSWELGYAQDATCGISLLTSIAMTSHGQAVDGSQDVARPPIRFGYSSLDPAAARVSFMEGASGAEPPPIDGSDTALVTLDRAPLPGVLQVINGSQFYWPNRGAGRWGEARLVAETPDVTSFGNSGVLFLDADGSATADMIVAGSQPLHGYYENGGDAGWTRFVAYPRGHAAAPSWSSGQVRLMDINGDGVVDAIASTSRAFTVWRNEGADGWSEPMNRPVDSENGPAGIDFSDPLVYLADMNGDGLADIVRVVPGLVEYWPGLGDGHFGSRVVMGSSPQLPGLIDDPASVVFVDVAGDGCADLVRVSGDGVEIAINLNGSEFGEVQRIAPIPVPIPGTVRAANMSGQAGTGVLWGSIRFGRPAYAQVDFTPGAPPYLLTTIDNGSGLRSELSYRSAVDDYLRDADEGGLWTTNLPFPLIVAARTREVDDVSGQETVVDYSYHEGHFTTATRQFQGFRRTERIERGDESRPDTLTVSHFLMDQERVPGNGPEHVELNGRLARTEIFALDGTPDEDRPYRVEECDYELHLLPTAPRAARSRSLVTVAVHRAEDHERTDDIRGEEKTYEYDAKGNVVRETTRGYGIRDGIVQSERIHIIEVVYATSAARNLIDKPALVVERDGNGKILREHRRYYDGPEFEGLAFGEVDRGLLVREEYLVLSEGEFAAHYEDMTAAELGYHPSLDADGTASLFTDKERCAYDARGLKIASRDPLGHEETYGYDSDGMFRTLLSDSLGETRYVFDRAAGQPQSTEFADGSVARFEYDAQGRVTASWLPGDDPTTPPRTFTFDDHSLPNARWATFLATPDESSTAVIYFDGHGREFQERVEAGSDRVVVSALSLRNPWGAVRREYEPTPARSLAFRRPSTTMRPHRAMRYDARGRVVETVDYGGGIARAAYRPFEVVLWDADRSATPRREEFDVLRQRTRVIQELGDGATASTSFDVSPAGDLLAVHDDSGTLSRYEFDRAGHRLVVDHREAGRRRLFYDARGATIGSIDANGNSLRAEIDAKGRLARLELDGVTVEELSYDDPARNALGRLASASYPGGRQDFFYDAAGRVLQHEYAFDGAARVETLSYEYDGLGRQLTVTHTDGRRIARELTPNGQVRAIPGILDEVSYDARGLPTALHYANGVVTEIEYTPGPGHVLNQRTTGPNGQVLHDVRYDRDALGLLLRSDDATPGGPGVREYSYDPLRQLREVTANNAPTLAYTYDDQYNLTGFGDTGAILHHEDPVRAYRLTGVTPPDSPLEAVNHDLNGNVASRGTQRFEYDYKSALTRFEDGRGLTADYGYDPFGVRVSKVVDDGRGGVSRTFFLDRDAEVRDGVSTLFVRLGDLRVAILSPTSTRYVHPDPLGTTAFFTDEAGTKVAAIAYLPFGNVAASAGGIDRRCFGTHLWDAESGLYYMQRRHYDPGTACFLQPDPIAVLRPERYLTVPRAFHPYAYVGNDPMNNADPNGLSFWSVVGAFAGVGLALYTGPIGMIISLVTVAYVVTSISDGNALGELARGFMIGMNSGLNTILGEPYLGTINFLAAFDGIAGSGAYQPVLGWSSWLMPMSWLATGLGLAVFVTGLTIAQATLNVWKPAHIKRIGIDWGTGSIVTHGGLFGPTHAGIGGYNLGNFVYGNRRYAPRRWLAHETGHTLNAAAFGGVFHWIGAIDQNILGRGWSSIPEQIADSHDPNSIYVDPNTNQRPGRNFWYMMWT